jgi:hypothetical protein
VIEAQPICSTWTSTPAAAAVSRASARTCGERGSTTVTPDMPSWTSAVANFSVAG